MSNNCIPFSIDTDCIYFMRRRHHPNPLNVGYYMGAFQPVWPGYKIITFQSFGPRTLCLHLQHSNGTLKRHIVIKSFSLKSELNSLQMTPAIFDTFMQSILKANSKTLFDIEEHQEIMGCMPANRAISIMQLRHRSLTFTSLKKLIEQHKCTNSIDQKRIIIFHRNNYYSFPYGIKRFFQPPFVDI